MLTLQKNSRFSDLFQSFPHGILDSRPFADTCHGGADSKLNSYLILLVSTMITRRKQSFTQSIQLKPVLRIGSTYTNAVIPRSMKDITLALKKTLGDMDK